MGSNVYIYHYITITYTVGNGLVNVTLPTENQVA